ncbi:MAG: hypothetical protein A2X12_03560 [Bacteroidetes bacterium GWE2_29_8]|nr:MAG: hypothetical protein A2X12_03560 [Bacteroidetes bacterium GWE2_29_8]OFY22727.1 MAG: hypothetical protein A2X02_02115 [Bacteroidetes bacterium GWF2_29_10]
MRNGKQHIILFIFLIISVVIKAQLPTLTTDAVSLIDTSSVVTGGDVTDIGGSPVTAKGVCWGTSSNPSVDCTNDGAGLGAFVSNLNNLIPNTLYYIRAYAINADGTAYGNEETFTTLPATPINRRDASFVTCNDVLRIKWDKPTMGSEIFTYQLLLDANKDGVTDSTKLNISSDSTQKTFYNLSSVYGYGLWAKYEIQAVNTSGGGYVIVDSILRICPIAGGGEGNGFDMITSTYLCDPPIPNNMYFGGEENSFASQELNIYRCPNFFMGGEEDGFYVEKLSIICDPPTPDNMYFGGISDGYGSSNQQLERCPTFFLGGEDDGFSGSDIVLGCPQPSSDDMYYGGIGHGSSENSKIQNKCPSFFFGGEEDGFTIGNIAQIACPPPVFTDMYLGGLNDGHSTSRLLQISCSSFFFGGEEDGFTMGNIAQVICPPPDFTNMYLGGKDDGFSSISNYQRRCQSFFLGGEDDGFVMTVFKPLCAPVAGFETADTNICQGETVSFIDTSLNSPTKWFWNFEGGTPDTSTAQNPIITYNSPGTYTVTLTVYNDNNGYSEPAISVGYINVGTNAAATITPDGPTTFCEGDSVVLTASAGVFYSWAPNSETTQEITVKTSGSYSVKVGCSVFSAPIVVNVFSAPVANITPGNFEHDSINGVDSIALSSTVASSYSWSTGEISQTISVKETGDYYLTITDANGCTAENHTVVIINTQCQAAISHRKIGLCEIMATPIDNKWVLVEWEAPYDLFSEFYTVEKSYDAVDFDSVGTLLRKPNIGTSQLYSLIDKTPYIGLSYYRLKNLNYYKNYRYSDVVEVMLNEPDVILLDMYPNPAREYIEFSFLNDFANTKINVEIKDITGRTINNVDIKLGRGESSIQLNISKLSKGLYIAIININANQSSLNKQIINKKFIKH